MITFCNHWTWPTFMTDMRPAQSTRTKIDRDHHRHGKNRRGQQHQRRRSPRHVLGPCAPSRRNEWHTRKSSRPIPRAAEWRPLYSEQVSEYTRKTRARALKAGGARAYLFVLTWRGSVRRGVVVWCGVCGAVTTGIRCPVIRTFLW